MPATRNPNLGPSHIRAKRRRLFWIRTSIVLFFVLLFIFSLAIFSGHKKVIIKQVDVSGNAVVSNDEILNLVNNSLKGRYFYLFSKNNFLIFPRFQIRKNILAEIKTIKEVKVSWSGWQNTSVSVTERKPHSVWCGIDIKNPQIPCFSVDKEGYIYQEAPAFSGSVFVKNYGEFFADERDMNNPKSFLGYNYLPTNIYAKIYDLIEIMEKKDMKVIALSFTDMDYQFVLEKGPTIILKRKDNFTELFDFEKSFSNLFIALETKNLDLENGTSTVDYIDLRFDDKVIIGKKPAK